MITKIVIGLVCLLWLIGGILAIIELSRSEEGYEDAKGYHKGKEPPK